MKFKVILRPDAEDGGFNISCPALPGCHSQGETTEEAGVQKAVMRGSELQNRNLIFEN